MKSLEYLKYCIKETMRLLPPVFAVGRSLAAPTEIDGYKLPAGASVGAAMYAAHHHPDFWENPEVRP